MKDVLNIKELEKELVSIVNYDKQSWTQFYLIMKDIEEKELWKELGERSFTSWVKNFCIRNKVHESIIWNRKKAGKVYESYQKIKEKQGEQVPTIEDSKVSVETLVLLDKINNKAPELAAELTDKAINKEMSREDLRNAYKAVRGNFNSKDNEYKSKDNYDKDTKQEEKNIVTAGLIVSALNNSNWLGIEKVKKHFKTSFEQNKYKCFTEFPLYTGTSKKSRRVDVLIAENLTKEAWELNLHGIEIKVSKSDLLGDTKYSEYAEYIDYMWLAIPEHLLNTAKETKFNKCGIIVIDKNSNIKIIEKAIKLDSSMKKDTLTSLALKLL